MGRDAFPLLCSETQCFHPPTSSCAWQWGNTRDLVLVESPLLLSRGWEGVWPHRWASWWPRERFQGGTPWSSLLLWPFLAHDSHAAALVGQSGAVPSEWHVNVCLWFMALSLCWTDGIWKPRWDRKVNLFLLFCSGLRRCNKLIQSSADK